MGLFGLGDFGTGFVEGFAKSANEALKEDLRKVDLRVERVAEAKMKRALKQQEERAEELEEIEDALKEGQSLFGDDPRGAEYAASLLKDQGNLTAYKSFIKDLREKKLKSGIDPAGFFTRAAVDAPASKGFTISDYAKAYQGAPKTLPDYRLPSDVETAGAGRLLSAIGLDQDVSGQIKERVSEQMAASGIIEDAAKPSISLPSIGFDSEEWNLADKDASAKIKYYNEKLVNPRLAEETRAKYEEKLQAQLGIAADSKDDEIRISALQQQLSRANVDDKPAIQKQITEIKIQQKRREAEAAVADNTDIMAVNKLEKADAYRRSQDETLSEEERKKALDEFYRVSEVITDYGKGEPTVAAKFEKRREDHRRKQTEDPAYKAGNPEFDAEVIELKKLEDISKDGSTKDASTAGITASVKVIDLITSTNPNVTSNIPNNKDFQRIKRAVDNEDTKSEGLSRLSTEKSPDGGPSEREIYDQGMAAMRSGGQPLVDAYIASLPEGSSDKASAIVAAEQMGYDVSAYTTLSTVTETATSTTVKDTAGAAADSASDDVTGSVIDSAEGAIQAIKKQKDSPNGYSVAEMESDLKQAIDKGASNDFVNAFKKEIRVAIAAQGTDENMVRAAMEPGIDYDQAAKEEQASAEQDVEAASKIIDDVTGFASKEIRAIQKQLGVSKEVATRLHAQAMAAKELNRTNTRSKRRGIMARSTAKAQG